MEQAAQWKAPVEKMQPWTNVETSMPPPDGRAVPSRLEELSAEWLTACLQHAGALAKDARVTGFAAARVGEGHGFAGQLARLELRYDPEHADAPRTLIGKFASDHAPTLEMMSWIDAYEREVRFYRELAKEVGVSTPRCYFAHYDRVQGRFCVLLEDLSPASAADVQQGLSVDQARLVLEQIAGLHAHWWNRVDEIEWLRLSEELVKRVRDRFIASLPSFVRRFGSQYPETAGVAAQMAELLSGDELLGKLNEPPMTLAHNDLHLDNVFLPTVHGGRFALIDWQSLSASRHGTTDVTRILCMGMQPALRRRHEHELLRHYHQRLLAVGVRGFSFRKLKRRFREETTAMVIVCVLAFDTLDLGDAQATAEVLGSRIEAALLDIRVSRMLALMLVWIRIRRWFRRTLTRAHLLGPG